MSGNYDLGMRYYKGIGFPISIEKAIYYFERALNQEKEYEAAYFIGEIYLYNYSSKINQAIKYFEIASQHGSYNSNCRLVDIYKDNTYGKVQWKKCVEYLNKCLNFKFDNNHLLELEKLVNKISKLTLESADESNCDLVNGWLMKMIELTNKSEVRYIFEAAFYKIESHSKTIIRDKELERIFMFLEKGESTAITDLKKFIENLKLSPNTKMKKDIENLIEEKLIDFTTIELSKKNFDRAYELSKMIQSNSSIANLKKKQAKVNFLANEYLKNVSKDSEYIFENVKYITDYNILCNINGEKLFDKLHKTYGFNGFYHQLNILNLSSVLECGYLYSRLKLENNFYNNANEEIIENTSDEIKSCARFYFAPKTPTNYIFEAKNPNDMVYLKFNWKVILSDENAMFCNGNAGSKYTKSISVKEVLQNKNLMGDIMGWEEIFARGPYNLYSYPDVYDEVTAGYRKNEIRRQRNAELAIHGEVFVEKYLENIIFKNQDSLMQFKKILNDESIYEKFKKYIIIDENYFFGNEVDI